jgi:hypothetical protein
MVDDDGAFAKLIDIYSTFKRWRSGGLLFGTSPSKKLMGPPSQQMS